MHTNPIRSLLLCSPVLFSLVLGACASEAGPPEATRVTAGLHHPESALFDPVSNRWFVTNIGEFGVPGDGFVSALDADGAPIDLRFIDGLDDPKGMAVHDGTLYVADLGGVHAIELASASRALLEVPGAAFLNDIVVDPRDASLLVSDTFGNAIFRVSAEGASEVLRDPALESPNGLALRGRALLISSTGPDPDPVTFETSAPGRLLRLDLDSGQLEILSARLGGLDGVGRDGDDVLVSDSFVGVYRVSPDGMTELVIDNATNGLEGSADFGMDAARGVIAVPELFGSEVTFFSLR